MLIELSGDPDRPLYAQLADAFRSEIARGALGEGETLPAARALAQALDMNVHTVLRAYQLLRDEGIVDLKRGRGARVTRAASSLPMLKAEVGALVHHAESLGISSRTLAAMIDGIDPDPEEKHG